MATIDVDTVLHLQTSGIIYHGFVSDLTLQLIWPLTAPYLGCDITRLQSCNITFFTKETVDTTCSLLF